MSASLSDLATSTSAYLSNDVATANSAATQLATLNGQISVTAATGGNTNALLDTRDQLLDTLSKSVGATATINANGTADVTVGGVGGVAVPLVSNITPTAMSVDSAYQVSVGGTAVALTGGTAAGEVTALTTTIPGYSAQLDVVANTLRARSMPCRPQDTTSPASAAQPLLAGTGAAGITLTDPMAPRSPHRVRRVTAGIWTAETPCIAADSRRAER